MQQLNTQENNLLTSKLIAQRLRRNYGILVDSQNKENVHNLMKREIFKFQQSNEVQRKILSNKPQKLSQIPPKI